MKEEEIKEFFDAMSMDRNLEIESNPIGKYEQDMRQRSVVELLNPTKGELILDVGCGNVRDLIIVANNGAKTVGIDLSSGMIKEGKKDINKFGLKNIDLIIGSGTNLPFKEETFDKIICSETIEHISNYEDAIAEMNRVLKIGGKLVITTPNWHSLYGLSRKLFTKPFHLLFHFLRFVLRKKNNPIEHPYDEWKTQKEVIEVLEKSGMEIDRKIGVCFIPCIPIRVVWNLPVSLKRVIVKLTFSIENKVRNVFTGHGYMIAVSAIKK